MTDASTLQTDANTTQTGADPKGGTTPPTTTPPATTEKPGSGKTFDPSELSDDQLAKVLEDKRFWQHSRVKQLQDRAKLADTLEKEKQEAEDAKLKEQGKLQELLDKKTQELDSLKTQMTSQKVDMAIQAEAMKTGVVDVEAALKLIDKSKVTISDDGQVSGVADAVKSLIEAKPYLAGKGTTTTVGQGSNPGGDGNSVPKKFKASQLKDVKFFRENEADIMKAMKLGLIEDDIPE